MAINMEVYMTGPNSDKTQHIPLSAALQKLSNFCCSYSLRENDELFGPLLTASISGNYARLTNSNSSKERLLNYFESVEKVLLVVFDLKEGLQTEKENRAMCSRKWARLICPPE